MKKTITDSQAKAILSALDAMMETDIALRKGDISTLEPGSLTSTIISLIETFSFCHPDLEKSFVNDNLREIAFAKKQQLIMLESNQETRVN
jgi:Ni2+-binding GTPase involved in maturation of urease and hydrogenase